MNDQTDPQESDSDQPEGEIGFKIIEQKVTRHSIEDLLNADLDKLTASFQQHAKQQLKRR